jgi:hypothetical protein
MRHRLNHRTIGFDAGPAQQVPQTDGASRGASKPIGACASSSLRGCDRQSDAAFQTLDVERSKPKA